MPNVRHHVILCDCVCYYAKNKTYDIIVNQDKLSPAQISRAASTGIFYICFFLIKYIMPFKQCKKSEHAVVCQ